MFFPLSFLIPLLLTIVIEIPIYYLFCRKSLSYLLAIYVMNIVLNITMNVILMSTRNLNYWFILGLLEVLVIAIEGVVATLFVKRPLNGFLASLIANLTSLGLGLLVNGLFSADFNGQLIFFIVLGSLMLIEFAALIIHAMRGNKVKEKTT